MKLKKYVDPRIKARAMAKAITKLGEVAAAHAKAAVELRDETERTIEKLGKAGITGAAANTIVAAICSPLYTCMRCGRDCLERDMSGEHCVECATALTRKAESRQFS
jgi:hypothetical protein